jgi:ribosomal protein S18 acetylase RimI-like enzyme
MPDVPIRRADRRPRFAPFVTIEVRRSARDAAQAAADRDFIRDLGRRSVMSSVASLRPASESNARTAFERLCEVVESQSNVTLVAEVDGERAGFLLLLDRLPDEVTLLDQAFVAYMAVEPALQGRGVGAALLNAAEDEARRRRLPYIALMVTEENDAAQRLYARSGYLTERRLLCKPL